jgi:hypothetical protein
MPTTPHIACHFTATKTVRAIVIGLSDRLNVPFELTAGISGARRGHEFGMRRTIRGTMLPCLLWEATNLMKSQNV